jgi:hypothetical protein
VQGYIRSPELNSCYQRFDGVVGQVYRLKEHSFTRCTLIVLTPRALAMANMPLPAVFDSDSFFQGVVDLRAPELLPTITAHPRDLHGGAVGGLRQSGWWPGHRAVLPSSPGSKQDASRIIKVWYASSGSTNWGDREKPCAHVGLSR